MSESIAARGRRGLSPSAEHYLRAIAELKEERGYARVVDIATRVGVTKGTVSVTLAQLAGRGLIRFDPARFPVLTSAGRRLAADVRGRFAIVHAFLTDMVGLPAERASAEACRSSCRRTIRTSPDDPFRTRTRCRRRRSSARGHDGTRRPPLLRPELHALPRSIREPRVRSDFDRPLRPGGLDRHGLGESDGVRVRDLRSTDGRVLPQLRPACGGRAHDVRRTVAGTHLPAGEDR